MHEPLSGMTAQKQPGSAIPQLAHAVCMPDKPPIILGWCLEDHRTVPDSRMGDKGGQVGVADGPLPDVGMSVRVRPPGVFGVVQVQADKVL